MDHCHEWFGKDSAYHPIRDIKLALGSQSLTLFQGDHTLFLVSEVVESCLEALFISIQQLADLFISNERLPESISIDHLRVWQYNLNQESLESLTNCSLVRTLTIPGDVSCDTDKDFNELISVKNLLSALFEGIGTHDGLIEALHYRCFIQEILLENAAFSSIIDEIFQR